MFTEEDFEEARLEQKEYGSLPQRIMMKRWEDCDRDVFKFWDSIEWDSSWLRHDTEEEKKQKEIARSYIGTDNDILGGDNNTSKGVLIPRHELL